MTNMNKNVNFSAYLKIHDDTDSLPILFKVELRRIQQKTVINL